MKTQVRFLEKVTDQMDTYVPAPALMSGFGGLGSIIFTPSISNDCSSERFFHSECVRFLKFTDFENGWFEP